LNKLLSLSEPNAADAAREGREYDDDEDDIATTDDDEDYEEETTEGETTEGETEDDESESASNTSGEDYYSDSYNDDAPPPHSIIFTFPLAPNTSSFDVLNLTSSDVSYVNIILQETNLDKLLPGDVHNFVCQYVNFSETLTKAEFEGAMKEMVASFDGYDLDNEVLTVFSNLYSTYDQELNDTASVTEICGGLTLLCKGLKSDKLSFLFQLFDKNDNGMLSDYELFLFFRSLMIIIFSLTSQGLELSPSDLSSSVYTSSETLAQEVFATQWEAGKHRITFDEFGEW
jgi:Ca2+-binding EF-hand superfamily protein